MTTSIVIGASSGIGREISGRLLSSGEKVVLCARRTELMEEIHSLYPESSFVTWMDVTDTDKAENLLGSLFDSHGPVDRLFFCSGTGELNPDLRFELEKSTIETNVTGFTALADLAFGRFVRQGYGHLVVISSVAATRGGAAAPAYNASKAYQVNYLEALNVIAAKSKAPVYVTDVRAGLVDTAMAKGEGLFWVARVDKAVNQILRGVRQKRRVVYVTRRWRFVAWLLRILPFGIYARL